MKKSLYVAFSVLLASLFAVGCADKSDDFVPSVGGEEEGGTAVFTFTPNFTGSTDTRAMSLQPYDPNDSENHSASSFPNMPKPYPTLMPRRTVFRIHIL